MFVGKNFFRPDESVRYENKAAFKLMEISKSTVESCYVN